MTGFILSDLKNRGGFRLLLRGVRTGERSEPKFFGPPGIFWPPPAGGGGELAQGGAKEET